MNKKASKRNKFTSISVAHEVLQVLRHVKANGAPLLKNAGTSTILRQALYIAFPKSYEAVIKKGEDAPNPPKIAGKKQVVQVNPLHHAFVRWIRSGSPVPLFTNATNGTIVEYALQTAFAEEWPEFMSYVGDALSARFGEQVVCFYETNDDGQLVPVYGTQLEAKYGETESDTGEVAQDDTPTLA